jgi:hypothetical protein
MALVEDASAQMDTWLRRQECIDDHKVIRELRGDMVAIRNSLTAAWNGLVLVDKINKDAQAWDMRTEHGFSLDFEKAYRDTLTTHQHHAAAWSQSVKLLPSDFPWTSLRCLVEDAMKHLSRIEALFAFAESNTEFVVLWSDISRCVQSQEAQFKLLSTHAMLQQWSHETHQQLDRHQLAISAWFDLSARDDACEKCRRSLTESLERITPIIAKSLTLQSEFEVGEVSAVELQMRLTALEAESIAIPTILAIPPILGHFAELNADLVMARDGWKSRLAHLADLADVLLLAQFDSTFYAPINSRIAIVTEKLNMVQQAHATMEAVVESSDATMDGLR